MGVTFTFDELIQYLETLGYIQGKGGKHQIVMCGFGKSIPIPSHKNDVPKGTASAIFKSVGSDMSKAKKWKENKGKKNKK
jgi:hypothetical protein